MIHVVIATAPSKRIFTCNFTRQRIDVLLATFQFTRFRKNRSTTVILRRSLAQTIPLTSRDFFSLRRSSPCPLSRPSCTELVRTWSFRFSRTRSRRKTNRVLLSYRTNNFSLATNSDNELKFTDNGSMTGCYRGGLYFRLGKISINSMIEMAHAFAANQPAAHTNRGQVQ